MFNMPVILLWLMLGSCWPGLALSQNGGDDPIGHIAYHVDPSGAQRLEQAITQDFSPLPSRVLNPGYTQAAYWFRIQPPGDARLLEVEAVVLDHIDLFLPDEQGGFRRIAAGDSLPFPGELDINHRHTVFRIPADVATPAYLRVQSNGPIQIPITMWRPEAFETHVARDEFVHGLYYGIMIIMVAYNLFLYLAVRDRNYLNYVFYIGSYILFQAALNGYGRQYLWPESVWLANHAQSFLLGLAVFAAAHFTHDFLDIPRTTPRFRLPLRAVQGCALGIMAAALLAPSRWSAPLANYLGLVLVLVVLPAAVSATLRRYRPAYWFLTAWGLFLIGIFTTGLALAGHIPYQFVTANAMQIGAALEVLLLSLALADRIGILRAEKEAAQAEANHHLRQLNEGLESQVRQHTAELTAANHALEETNRTLAEIAKHDGLTGLYNHASFMSLLPSRIDEARRYAYPIALIMVDIDHFKHINDRFGHPLGDRALAAVAEVLSQGKRTSDEAARYGGEEFAVLLPHTDLDAAARLAERLRQAIAATGIEGADELALSASFGVAAIPADDAQTTPMQLLQRADDALYRAKDEGRNRVCRAS